MSVAHSSQVLEQCARKVLSMADVITVTAEKTSDYMASVTIELEVPADRFSDVLDAMRGVEDQPCKPASP